MQGDILFHAVFSIIISFLIHLICHEIGHLLGGLITGWSLLYLQIFNVAIVKGKRFPVVKIVDTITFQCIMSPLNLYSNPFLYTLGGCILNLFLTISGLIILIIGRANEFVLLYSWSFIVMGSGFLYMNGIARVNQICNDMACYHLTKKDIITRLYHNAQLMVAKYLYKGYSYKDIGEMICLPFKFHNANNDILAYQAILEYYYYLELDNVKGQKSAIEKISNAGKLSHSTISYLNIERIYKNVIDKIKGQNQSLEKESHKIEEIEKLLMMYYIKGDVHMERVRAVFEAYKELNIGCHERARDRINKAIEDIKNMSCVYRGEKEFCLNQLRKIQEII